MRLLFLLFFSFSAYAISFDFEIGGDEPMRGRAVVVADSARRGPQLRIESGATTIWADGVRVHVVDAKARTHTHSTFSRTGLLLLGRASRGVAAPFAFSNWAADFAAYKPKAAGTSVVRGVKCKVTELLIPSGGWRWHYGPDGVLRREERLGTKEVVDYWNFGTRTKIGAQPPVPDGFTSKEFMPAGPAPGALPAKWSATTLTGRPVTSDELRGRVVVVDFWATWCAPCRASMPHLQKLYEEYRGKGVEVIGISWRDSGDAAAKYAQKHALTYPLATSPEAIATFGTDEYGLPLLYVLGRDGRVVDFTVGYAGERTERWLREVVEGALGVH